MSQLSVFSIYVSHNSDEYIKKFSDSHKDELGEKVFLINSGSNVIKTEDFHDFKVINIGRNIGFSAANNIGIELCLKENAGFFLIINPDVLLPANWLNSIESYLLGKRYEDVGVFTVPLLGYDFENDKPTGLIDSMGLYSTWYGRWYDCLAGESVDMVNTNEMPYDIPASCGALMVIRSDVIKLLLNKEGYVFNESFFMYKEDIELSIRIRKLGKRILMLPSSPVYHCRGWNKDRVKSPYWARELSARNELNMHLKYYWRFLPYSCLKYLYVRFFERFILKLTKHVM